MHGLYGTPQQLQYLGRKLSVEAGLHVCIPTIEGYTVPFDEPVPKNTSSWKQWLTALNEILDEMLTQYDEVSVGGLCMGAVLGLALASERSADIKTLLVYSAPLKFDGWNVPWTYWIRYLGYYTPARFIVSLAELPPYGLKDERIRHWVSAQMQKKGTSALGSSRSPLKGIFYSEQLMRHTKQSLGKITAPTLIIHSHEDDIASVKNAHIIEQNISSGRVRKVLLNDCYHVITMDLQKDIVVSETLSFLQENKQYRETLDYQRQII